MLGSISKGDLAEPMANFNIVACWLQVLQAGFVDKTAQLQALQQQLSGRRTPDPELTALQREMHESQARQQ